MWHFMVSLFLLRRPTRVLIVIYYVDNHFFSDPFKAEIWSTIQFAFFESNQTDSLKKIRSIFFECAVMVLHCCMNGYDVGEAELANILINVYIYFIIYHSSAVCSTCLFLKFIL